VDPFEIMEKYGADVLRWYLIVSSPPWRPKMFNEDDLVESRNKFFDTLINTYRFFVLYSNLLAIEKSLLTQQKVRFENRPEIDRWIISLLNSLKDNYFGLMDAYDLTRAARLISDFTIDDLSNWYIRRNRKRFRNPENEIDKLSAYQTLYEVLIELIKMVSPISPFLTEELYRNLVEEESVHLSLFADINNKEIDKNLESEMKLAQKIVYLVRSMRVKFNLKTRQPLRQILIPEMNEYEKRKIEKMKKIILEEVNVKELNFIDEESGIIIRKAKPNFKILGPKYGKDMKAASEAISKLDNHSINVLEKQGEIVLNFNGSQYKISKEDVEILTESIEGWIVGNQNNFTVALDTKLDQELINEGLAREFINRIQNLRKEKEMDVNDRIKIYYDCEEDLDKALIKQNTYIKDETFADELLKDRAGKNNGFEVLNINGKICKVYIVKT
jgi:isoleucyl-tRNA synthetase